MGNLTGEVNILTTRIDKGGVNEKSLVDLFSKDSDFSVSDAERISKDIYEDEYEKHDKSTDEEWHLIESMVISLFDTPNFIGLSDEYGHYEFDIVETDFEFIVIIAYIN